MKTEVRKSQAFFSPDMSAKWLRMWFQPLPVLTRDVLWMEVSAILEHRTAYDGFVFCFH